MDYNIYKNLSSKYKDYNVEQIESGASKRKFYRFYNDSDSIVYIDSINEEGEYFNYLKVHEILSKIDISIPKIFEKDDQKKIILVEDLGKLRYDKVLSKYPLKDLISNAVKTLIIFNKEINFNVSYNLPLYKFATFKTEISEFIDYYCPYIIKKKVDSKLKEDFFTIWENNYNKIDFKYNSFVHKDFNINNLMHIPNRKNHRRCGVLDFQNAFWGESCWDLFSLLEDSRVYYDDQYNNDFLNFYFYNTNQNETFDNFKTKYYLLNCSRQTRLLGRWIKLYKQFDEKLYLKFIPITKKRLINGLLKLGKKDLQKYYSNFIPELNE